jgi:hypothetical protein
MDLSVEEEQLIELIRSQSTGDEIQFLIERDGGAWHVTVSIPPHHERASYGKGGTFSEAWSKASPLWARQPHPKMSA